MTKNFPLNLYHYTSTAAFFGILHGKSFWASSTQHLNDSNEGQVFSEKVVTIADRLGVAPTRVNTMLRALRGCECYLTCFSGKADVLSQWRGYADEGRGVCIILDTKKLIEVVAGDPRALVRPVQYLAPSDDLPGPAATLAAALIRSGGVPPREGLVSAAKSMWEFKNYGFIEEAEYRLILTPYEDDSDSFQLSAGSAVQRQHRYQANGIREYFDVSLSVVWPDVISGVVLGPKNDSHLPSVTRLLRQNGVPTATVTKSEIPFR